MSPNDEWIARHLRITGRVQGVGFRWNLARLAKQHGVTGWVRNRHDGSVEALVCGAPHAVAAMIHWASLGPAGADVQSVDVEEAAASERVQGFEQRATQ